MLVKLRGKNSGHRGCKARKRTEAISKKLRKRIEARKEEEKLHARLVARVCLRIKHACQLSDVGLAVEPSRVDDIRNERYYSLDGPVDMAIYGGEIYARKDREWDDLCMTVLGRLANTSRWQPVLPKNAMQVLAEAADGRYDY